MAMQRVFVYGTLKTGEPNHHWLSTRANGYSKLMGSACTQREYPLVIATQYNIPFLLYVPGEGHIIQGEVYEVDNDMLIKLDELEDHPNFYIRDLYTVSMEDIETKKRVDVECWIYFLKEIKPELLEKTRYSCYSSTGDHNLPYMERSKRNPNIPLHYNN